MQNKTKTMDEYISQLPEDRKEPISKIRNIINQNIDKGFEEVISYNMPSWVVPHSLYPDGYHCDPKLPLPFLSIDSQKHFVAIYHMGVYANPELMNWLVNEYSKYCPTILDMGKSCIRFKKIENIPYELIEELVSKMSVNDWIQLYEFNVKKSRKQKK